MNQTALNLIWIPIYLVGVLISSAGFGSSFFEGLIEVIPPFIGSCIIVATVCLFFKPARKYFLILSASMMVLWVALATLILDGSAVGLVMVTGFVVLAFGVGYLYTQFFGMKDLPGKEGVSAQKELAGLDKTSNIHPINPTTYQDTSKQTNFQRLIQVVTKERVGHTPEERNSAVEEVRPMDKQRENEFYEIAWSEVQNDQTKKSIWARAFSESDGQVEKTKARYISLRVDDLRHEEEARINERKREELKVQVEQVKQRLTAAMGEELVAAMDEKLFAVTKAVMSDDDLFAIFADKMVLDAKTNLMWAAQDNGSNIDHYDAVSYCEKYREGGYMNWRLPRLEELAELHGKMYRKWIDEEGSHVHLMKLIQLSSAMVWAFDTMDTEGTCFNFNKGEKQRQRWLESSGMRALPVRSVK